MRLPQLQAALIVAARREERGARRLLHVRRRPLVLVVVLVLGGATAALAASGVFQTGTPVGPPAGYAPVASVGFGAPQPGGIRVLGLRAADPAGGPPWGIGVFRTTQGLACSVTARVVDGRLGVLGIDYAFADDGRFHPILAASAITPYCTPPDARGHLYITGGGWLLNASGYYAPACLMPGSQGDMLRCPQSDLRSVFSGFLGPTRAASPTASTECATSRRPSAPTGRSWLSCQHPQAQTSDVREEPGIPRRA
jgi:hypothetical protein